MSITTIHSTPTARMQVGSGADRWCWIALASQCTNGASVVIIHSPSGCALCRSNPAELSPPGVSEGELTSQWGSAIRPVAVLAGEIRANTDPTTHRAPASTPADGGIRDKRSKRNDEILSKEAAPAASGNTGETTMARTKIASRKKKKATARDCPVCDSEMEVTRVMRYSEGPSGMLWTCTNTSCLTLVSKDGVKVGSLLEEN